MLNFRFSQIPSTGFQYQKIINIHGVFGPCILTCTNHTDTILQDDCIPIEREKVAAIFQWEFWFYGSHRLKTINVANTCEK